MKIVPCKRIDIVGDGAVTFVKNLFWGLWNTNLYYDAELVCGACNSGNEVTIREKNGYIDCPCCGARNTYSFYGKEVRLCNG